MLFILDDFHKPSPAKIFLKILMMCSLLPTSIVMYVTDSNTLHYVTRDEWIEDLIFCVTADDSIELVIVSSTKHIDFT